MFEAMKKVADVIEINLPIGASIAIIQASELKDWVSIGVGIIGAICTILITRHKLKQREKD